MFGTVAQQEVVWCPTNVEMKHVTGFILFDSEDYDLSHQQSITFFSLWCCTHITAEDKAISQPPENPDKLNTANMVLDRDIPIRSREWKSGPNTWFQTWSESDVTSWSGLGYMY